MKTFSNTKKFYRYTLLLLIAFTTMSFSENSSSDIEIKVGDNWIVVADRNCGATSNGSTSYGEYYAWNKDNGKSPAEASEACESFKGSDNSSDWRLPTKAEGDAIAEKLVISDSEVKLHDQRGDGSKFIYFPYTGWKRNYSDSEVNSVGRLGFYWVSNAHDSSRANNIYFYPDGSGTIYNPMKQGFTVRCVKSL